MALLGILSWHPSV